MILPLAAGLLLVQKNKLPPPTPMIYDIEVAPNDQWMAVSNSSDNIWIYSLQGKLIRTLHHKSGSHLVDIEISPDGKLIACTNINYSGDYCPEWSTQSWKEVAKVGSWVTKSFCNPPNSIEYAGGGKYLVGTSMSSRELFCWSAQTGAVSYIARTIRAGYYRFAINPNSSFAVLAEYGAQRMRFWDFGNSGKVSEWGSEITGIDPSFVRNMKFSPDGKRLFVITQPQKTYCDFNILKPSGGKTTFAVQDRVQGLQPRDIAWAGDGTEIWVGGLNAQMVCFELSSGTLKRHWTAGNGGVPIHAVAATHRGHTVISSAGESMSVWDGDSGKLLRTFKLSAK